MLLWLMNLGFAGGGQVIPPVPPTTPSEQPAGRRRKRVRLIARHKGHDYYFRSVEALEAYVKSVTKHAELKQDKPPVKIIVPAALDDEMAELDLPSLQPVLSKFDWEKAKAILDRAYHEMEGIKARMAMDAEDEELLLL